MKSVSNQFDALTTRDRLSSIDLLQVKKVKEHVYQKILKLDDTSNGQQLSQSIANEGTTGNISTNTNDSQSCNPKESSSINSLNTNSNSSNGTNASDVSTLAGRSIELICSDNVRNVFIFTFKKIDD